MYVIRHAKQYLINLSHNEMEALRKVVDAGLLLLDGENDEGLWANITTGERMAIGKWRGNPLMRITGPKAGRRKQRNISQDKPLSSVT